jgi:hypothetical protein
MRITFLLGKTRPCGAHVGHRPHGIGRHLGADRLRLDQSHDTLYSAAPLVELLDLLTVVPLDIDSLSPVSIGGP